MNGHAAHATVPNSGFAVDKEVGQLSKEGASHADDVVIMGAFGGYERGWEQVSARLDRAAAGIKATDRAAENVVTVVGDDLAYTVDLEHMTRHAGGQPQPRTLRSTQVYRRENGEWKLELSRCNLLISDVAISAPDPPRSFELFLRSAPRPVRFRVR